MSTEICTAAIWGGWAEGCVSSILPPAHARYRTTDCSPRRCFATCACGPGAWARKRLPENCDTGHVCSHGCMRPVFLRHRPTKKDAEAKGRWPEPRQGHPVRADLRQADDNKTVVKRKGRRRGESGGASFPSHPSVTNRLASSRGRPGPGIPPAIVAAKETGLLPASTSVDGTEGPGAAAGRVRGSAVTTFDAQKRYPHTPGTLRRAEPPSGESRAKRCDRGPRLP